MTGGLNDIMRQAQRMQSEIAEVREEVADREFEASMGGGAVVATVNGDQEVLNVEIDPDAVEPDDVDVLEEMITGAINRALEEANETLEEEIEEVTGGMDVPGLF
ncbi:MAG: YbaB/EbfC family nucleoid-associated protein [Bradymonadaceae bacterium]